MSNQSKELEELSKLETQLRSRGTQQFELEPSFARGIVRKISERRVSRSSPWSSWFKVALPTVAIVCVALIAIRPGEVPLPQVTDLPSANLPNLGNYNDTRISTFTNRVFAYVEGSLGAVVMVVFALAALIFAALRRFKLALLFLILAALCFIARSMVASFFNDQGIAALIRAVLVA